MNLSRLLIGFVGSIFAFVGFMRVTGAWMNNATPDFAAWAVKEAIEKELPRE